jgi:hypothetical protein
MSHFKPKREAQAKLINASVMANRSKALACLARMFCAYDSKSYNAMRR